MGIESFREIQSKNFKKSNSNSLVPIKKYCKFPVLTHSLKTPNHVKLRKTKKSSLSKIVIFKLHFLTWPMDYILLPKD